MHASTYFVYHENHMWGQIRTTLVSSVQSCWDCCVEHVIILSESSQPRVAGWKSSLSDLSGLFVVFVSVFHLNMDRVKNSKYSAWIPFRHIHIQWFHRPCVSSCPFSTEERMLVIWLLDLVLCIHMVSLGSIGIINCALLLGKWIWMMKPGERNTLSNFLCNQTGISVV